MTKKVFFSGPGSVVGMATGWTVRGSKEGSRTPPWGCSDWVVCATDTDVVAVRTVQSLCACTRVLFTFTFKLALANTLASRNAALMKRGGIVGTRYNHNNFNRF